MKTLVVVLAVITLACASARHHEEALNTWIGHDVNELIQAWGPPANTYELPNGEKMYSWYYDGGVVAVPVGSVVYGRKRNCQTTFTVDKAGVVETWRYQGNAC